MLREIRSSFLAPRLMALKYTTASNAVTVSAGLGCVNISSNAAGRGIFTFRPAFARRAIMVATASSADVAAGGFASNFAGAYPSALGHTLTTVNSSVSGDDGTCYALALGYDSRDATRYSRAANLVRGEIGKTKIIAIRVNTAGSGTVTINARAVLSIARTGTGDVTLTLRSAFTHTSFVAVASAVSATGQIVQTDVTSSSSVRVKVFTNGGTTPADGLVNLLLVGDIQSDSEKAVEGSVMSDQRKPILFGYSIVYAAGAPTYDLNSGDATLVDTATGRVTFTFNQAFRRDAIVVATPMPINSTTQCCTIDNSASTGFEVKQFNAGNALVDSANGEGFQLIGVGFDDPSEY